MEAGFGDTTQPQDVAIGHPMTTQVEGFQAHLYPRIGMMKPPMPQRGDFSFGTSHLDHRRGPSAREVINRTLPILAQRTRKVSGKTVRSIAKKRQRPEKGCSGLLGGGETLR